MKGNRDMRLSGKTALVTGAGSGIGLATVRRLRSDGATVYAADLSAPERMGDGHYPLTLDVTREAAWQDAIAMIGEGAGRLDVLVNNAGIGHAAPITEMTLADWRRVQGVNLEGVFLGMKHAAPLMKTGGGGVIVNLSSICGTIGVAQAAAYCASKAGVLGLTRAGAHEFGPDNIRVVAVQPGYVETPLVAARLAQEPARLDAMVGGNPLRRLGTPEEIAGLIAYLAGDEAAFVTGAGLLIDGGATI